MSVTWVLKYGLGGSEMLLNLGKSTSASLQSSRDVLGAILSIARLAGVLAIWNAGYADPGAMGATTLTAVLGLVEFSASSRQGPACAASSFTCILAGASGAQSTSAPGFPALLLFIAIVAVAWQINRSVVHAAK